ncbi:MAG TPA: hypothetical protein VKZ89_17925 [Thermobifida alba]|nr:hypothetical protein [Thermobifida alba]
MRRVPRDVCRPIACRSGEVLWAAVCGGREPAEALHPQDREDLVAELVGLGWTDLEIAALTRMTTYTTARIRQRLELPPNEERTGAAA